MTQDEIIAMAREVESEVGFQWCVNFIELERFAALVAAKQIAEFESQEPVGRFAKFTDGVWRPVTDYSAGVPLYAHPPQRTEQEPQIAINAQVVGYVEPQRTWVGLTDEEIEEAIKSCNTTDTYKYFRAIEAKLKEKNT